MAVSSRQTGRERGGEGFPPAPAVTPTNQSPLSPLSSSSSSISNQYDLHAFRRLFVDARVKPAVLQNRFYADSGYDVELRRFCDVHGVVYQSFWTLTGNRDILFDEAQGGGVKEGSANEVGRTAARAAVAAAAVGLYTLNSLNPGA
jgi:hypothetical protein